MADGLGWEHHEDQRTDAAYLVVGVLRFIEESVANADLAKTASLLTTHRFATDYGPRRSRKKL